MIVDDLKKSILNYAIEGKLSSTYPSDTSIEKVLNKIFAQKESLSKKEVKISSEIYKIENDIFNIPKSWKFVRIGQISKTISKGTTPKGGKNAYKKEGIPFARAENINKTIVFNSEVKYIDETLHFNELKRSILIENDILICIAGTLGRCAVVRTCDLPLNINQAVAFIRLVNPELVSPWFLYYVLSSDIIQKQLLKQKKDTAIPNLTLEIITNCIIPLPPIEEQHRIVDKIQELFAKLDEIKPIERELLNIKNQFPTDMRVSILKNCYDGIYSNLNFDEWQNDKLINVCDEICTGNSISESDKKSKYTNLEKGYNYIATKDLNFDHTFIYENGIKIPFGSEKFKIAKQNDILLCIEGGSAGKKVGILEEQVCYGNKLCKFSSSKLNSKFLYYYLQSPQFTKNFYDNISGIIGGVSINKIKSINISYPPLEEQQRIVATIEQLIPLCDDIEKVVNQ